MWMHYQTILDIGLALRPPSSKFILGFIVVSNIWIERVVEAKQGLTDRFTCPNHWLQHRNRNSSYH